MSAPTPPPDPCPGASIPLRTGGVIHVHLVPCEVCGRRLFYAWYSGTGHRCGRCRGYSSAVRDAARIARGTA